MPNITQQGRCHCLPPITATTGEHGSQFCGHQNYRRHFIISILYLLVTKNLESKVEPMARGQECLLHQYEDLSLDPVPR